MDNKKSSVQTGETLLGFPIVECNDLPRNTGMIFTDGKQRIPLSVRPDPDKPGNFIAKPLDSSADKKNAIA
jgi:hypothetical protein